MVDGMPERESNPLASLFGLAKRLELETDAGRVNFFGMGAVTVALVVYAPADWLDAILVALDKQPLESSTDIQTLLIIFVVGFLICVAMLTWAQVQVHGAGQTPRRLEGGPRRALPPADDH